MSMIHFTQLLAPKFLSLLRWNCMYTGLRLESGQDYARDSQSEYKAPKDCALVMPDPKPRVGNQGVAYLYEVKSVFYNN